MARHSGPSRRILEHRRLTSDERELLQILGRPIASNQALLTLECGHHVLRVNPDHNGAIRSVCRLCP